MNNNQQNAIVNFFKAAEQLKVLGVIRSSSYTGNIAEFVCANLFNIKLSNSQREVGLDGIDSEGKKVEIKYHNAERGTNIIMSKYKSLQNFGDLIVIIGPKSTLRPKKCEENVYLVYKIENYNYKTHGDIAKKKLRDADIKFVLDENLTVIKTYQ